MYFENIQSLYKKKKESVMTLKKHIKTIFNIKFIYIFYIFFSNFLKIKYK